MKFELDNKTGMMIPKEDRQLYFAKSMSGGLRVDDRLNNIKYVIERNESVTFISGNHKINIYDMRNAKIISERVKRMFGGNHKYANYKYFLKGGHIIESFDGFINELWYKGMNRNKTGENRLEDTGKIKLPNGKIVRIDDRGYGVPYKLDKDNDLYYRVYDVKGKDTYFFGFDDDGVYNYCIYDEDAEDKDDELICVLSSVEDFCDNDFIYLRAFLNSELYDNDEILNLDNPSDDGHIYKFIYENKGDIVIMSDDYDELEKYTIDTIKSYLEGDVMDKKEIDRYIGFFGNDFIDEDYTYDSMKGYFDDYVYSLRHEDGTMGNALNDLLEQYELIEDTDEYFKTEDDGETLDYTLPLFDEDDKSEELITLLCDDCDGYDDSVDWYLNNFDEYSRIIDYDKLAEDIVNADGVEQSLGSYESDEVEIDGITIYIYQI